MFEKLLRTRLEELIVGFSVATVLALTRLPYEYIDGNPVPKFIFKDRPSLFQSFVLALNFSFFGSVTTIPLRDKFPKIAKSCLVLAVVSVVTAFGILLYVGFTFCSDGAFSFDVNYDLFSLFRPWFRRPTAS